MALFQERLGKTFWRATCDTPEEADELIALEEAAIQTSAMMKPE